VAVNCLRVAEAYQAGMTLTSLFFVITQRQFREVFERPAGCMLRVPEEMRAPLLPVILHFDGRIQTRQTWMKQASGGIRRCRFARPARGEQEQNRNRTIDLKTAESAGQSF